MFKNIGRKIKTLALVLFWIEIVIGVLAALGSGIAMIVTEGRYNGMMIVAGVATIVIGSGLVFLFAWIGSFFMYGLGQLIDDTEINRKTNQQILEKLNSKPVEKAPEAAPTIDKQSTPMTKPNTPIVPVVLDNGRIRCPHCGTVQPGNRTVCWDCGTRFSPAQGTPDHVENIVNTPPAELVVNTPVPPVTSWVCPKCGNVNDLNAQFCTNCGTRKA